MVTKNLKPKSFVTVKDISIEVTEDVFIETSTEIKYDFLKNKNWPLHSKNFATKLFPEKIILIAFDNVTVGDRVLTNTVIRVLVYRDFKILEFKNKELKIGFSVDIKDRLIEKKDSLFEYNINPELSRETLKEVCGFFYNIFNGENITFKIEDEDEDFSISFNNEFESLKFKSFLEFLEMYEKICLELDVKPAADISKIDNSYYELYLIEKMLNDEQEDLFINFSLENKENIILSDRLIFKRKHKINFHNLILDLEEIIALEQPLTLKDINNGRIKSNNKLAVLSVERIN